MDYANLIDRLKRETYWLGGSEPYSRDIHPQICDEAADVITDLLALVDVTEARCQILEKIVEKYQNELIPGYRETADKAESERNAAKARINILEAVLKMVENIQEYYPPDTKFCLHTEKELAKYTEAQKQLEDIRRILSDPLIVCGEGKTLRPVKRTSRQDVYTTVLKAQKAAGIIGRWFPSEWETEDD